MDGNGRWASARGYPRIEGHRRGVNAAKEMVRCCLKNGIAVLSLFSFGRENWARPVTEVNFLMQLFLKVIGRDIAWLHAEGVQLRFVGERAQLSQALQEKIIEAETLTQNNQCLILNIVMNYSGRWDILQAAKTLALDVASGLIAVDAINEEMFSDYCNTRGVPDPDLLIRTGGEKRISNFYLWQLAFTELHFSEVFWPDFSSDEFAKALLSFQMRERRFGKTSSQLTENNNV